MTIDFALSLSPQGIELLHRVQRGWRRIGHANVASATLTADLAVMHKTAVAIAPDGLRTKLIIPADQIKYTAIDSTMTTTSDIHKALDGATPYALDDLVIDFERFGGRTHIAAVARETLQEAESFAKAHHFNPVAFVAVPEPFTFQKEVFFGPTTLVSELLGPDAIVTRDSLPVMIIGTRLKSRLLVFDLPEDAETHNADGALLAMLTQRAAAPAPVTTSDAVTDVPARQTWVDLAIAEYHVALETHAPQEAVKSPVVPVIPDAPVLAAVGHLDKIIAEVYPPIPAPSRTRLVTDAGHVANTGPTPRVAQHAAQRQVAAPARRRAAIIAASLAVAGAVSGGLIWMQQNATPATVAQTPAPAPMTQTADTRDVGPDIALFAVTDFAAEQVGETALPELTGVGPVPVVPVPEPLLLVQSPDQLPVVAPPPASVQTIPAQAVGTGEVLSPAEAARIYAATGVWLRAPRFFDIPKEPAFTELLRGEDDTAPNRVAQPAALAFDGLATDLGFLAPADPPPADAEFTLDEAGFVLATPDGSVTPDGAVVFAGLPDLTVTPRPEGIGDTAEDQAPSAATLEGVVVNVRTPDVTPVLRPADATLADTPEAVDPDQGGPALGSVGLAGLAMQDDGTVDRSAIPAVRPQNRPDGLGHAIDPATPDITAIISGIEADDATLRFDTSSALAVTSSRRPQGRPGNFAQIVAAAQAQVAPAQTAAAAAPPAPEETAVNIQPRNTTPLPGGVARAATQEDAIRLRQINLIGVYGRPNDRRALVRLSNGRFVRVEVGSELDGGQVTAIGEKALNYVKRGQTYAIEIPSG